MISSVHSHLLRAVVIALLALPLLAAAVLPPAQTSATATPITPSPSPTVDRLAAPPTVPAPTQADEGAQLYWLWCQPCHGDQGQGLTDEWRAQYPPEDRNCWESGCHGAQPYEDGFTLPRAVPAVVGPDSLLRFTTLGQLYDYVQAVMPYEYPGVLSDEEYLAITAYLARQHEAWDDIPLDKQRAHELPLHDVAPPATPVAPPATTPAEEPPGQQPALLAVSLSVMLLLFGGIGLWRRMRL